MHNIKLTLIDSEDQAAKQLGVLGVSPAGIFYMRKKMPHLRIKIDNLKIQPANFIKQEMLARGGDAIISKEALYLKGKTTDCLLFGTIKQYELLIDKLKHQAFGLKILAAQLEGTIQAVNTGPDSIIIGGVTFNLARKAYVVGILNTSPDSFYDGSAKGIADHGERASMMEQQGADIIEIGGQSAIPGKPITIAEEIERVVPVLKQAKKRTSIPISIDTYRAEVAHAAVYSGADMINDITGLENDKMLEEVVNSKKPIVIMHIKGKPKVRQHDPKYNDLMSDVCRYFRDRIRRAEEAGVAPESIIIDPGLGFGKNTQQNLQLTQKINELKSIGKPIMYAASHKSFIGDVLRLPVNDRLEGTLAANVWAMLSGANFIRVHNITELKQAVDVSAALKSK